MRETSTVNHVGSSLRVVIPHKIVKLFGIEDGDTLVWEDDLRSGRIVVKKTRF